MTEEATTEIEILSWLNAKLEKFNESCCNLDDDLEDGYYLLLILFNFNALKTGRFNRRTKGKTLESFAALDNRCILVAALNKVGHIYSIHTRFSHDDIFRSNKRIALSLIQKIVDSSLITSRLEKSMLLTVEDDCSLVSNSCYSDPSRWTDVVKNKVIRVFLSSTFRDMQRERDAFFKFGEPRLQTWANQKGYSLVFVDLRWGLTYDVSRNGEVTIRCFESIEKCHYFVCFLGARYGWIPDHSKPQEWHPDTEIRYPFLGQYNPLSVTHYEIIYGALMRGSIARRAFFFERCAQSFISNLPDATENEMLLYAPLDENDSKLQDSMKQEIRHQYQIQMYRSSSELVDLTTIKMITAMKADLEEQESPHEDDIAHEQTMRHRLSGFTGRNHVLCQLKEEIERQLSSDESMITVLGAESGVGKSSVMAAIAHEYSNKRNIQVLQHYVGSSNQSQYVENLNARAYRLLYEKGLLKFHMESIEGRSILDLGLAKILRDASQGNNQIILVVDAINQFCNSQEHPHPFQLHWLPKSLPKNIAIVVSTIDTHTTCQVARASGLELIPLGRMTGNEVVAAARLYMEMHHKSLSDQQEQLIVDKISCTGHPLYLRLALDEMRVFGVFERILQEMRELLSTDGVEEIYELVASRWENNYGRDVVRVAMTVLCISRIGLSEEELDAYVTHRVNPERYLNSMQSWKPFFFKLLDSLFIRNGRYTYFHQLLQSSAQRKYLDVESIIEEYRHLADWLIARYENQPPTEIVVAEICHSLLMSKNLQGLEKYLSQEQVVVSMLKGKFKYEFYQCWRELNIHGFDHKVTYKPLSEELTPVGSCLVSYFREVHENGFLVDILRRRIEKRRDEVSQADEYYKLGQVYENMGKLDDALEIHNQALSIRKRAFGEEHADIASSYNNIANIHGIQGRLDQSLEFHYYALRIRTKLLGDHHPDVAMSYNNIASVNRRQGKMMDALENYNKALSIRMKTFGSEHPDVASTQNNIAVVHFSQERYDEALESFQTALKIQIDAFGTDHPSSAATYGNMGLVFKRKKMYDQAIDCYQKSLSSYTKILGEQHVSVAVTFYNLAGVYESLGNYRQAIRHFTDARNIYEKVHGQDHAETKDAQRQIYRMRAYLQ